MNTRLARWLALVLVGIYVVLATVGLTLQSLAGSTFADIGIPTPGFFVFYGVLGVLVAIGARIVWRHPRHPVGWLLCAGLLVPTIDPLASGYIGYSLRVEPGLAPEAILPMLWLNTSGMPFGVLLFTLMFLLSPTGRLPSRRWRSVAWAAVGALAVYLGLKSLEPGPLMLFPSLDNPLGANQAAWAIGSWLMRLAFVVLVACYLAAFGSLIVRLRRGRGVERQQVKWLILPTALFGVGIPFVGLGQYDPSRVLFGIGSMIHIVAVSGLVIATAFAIFKYRLYDIDLIINRTLVYGALTGTLALVYAVSVIVLQRIFPAESQLAIVVSTLTIAALFSPLRRRIQNDIDRRFYRRRYDARQVLAAFSIQMQEEVELEMLSEALLGVVEEVVQPRAMSLWLKRQ